MRSVLLFPRPSLLRLAQFRFQHLGAVSYLIKRAIQLGAIARRAAIRMTHAPNDASPTEAASFVDDPV